MCDFLFFFFFFKWKTICSMVGRNEIYDLCIFWSETCMFLFFCFLDFFLILFFLDENKNWWNEYADFSFSDFCVNQDTGMSRFLPESRLRISGKKHVITEFEINDFYLFCFSFLTKTRFVNIKYARLRFSISMRIRTYGV